VSDPGVERTVRLPGKDRLDKELCFALEISRQSAKLLILSGRVRIDGITRHHPARRIGKESSVEILSEIAPPASRDLRPAVSIDIQVLYEDDAILAVSKPAGLSVHPGAGHEKDTLVDLLRHRPSRSADGGGRAGLVHRLDKETSGVLLLAKQPQAMEHLMYQFAERKVEKEYRAVIRGMLPPRPIRIVGAIGRSPEHRKKFGIQPGGRDAVTILESLASTPSYSLVRVTPKTGRTHQIRVHVKHAGFPIVGDPVYGLRVPGVGRMLLHAYRIVFTHPVSGKRVQIVDPLPRDFVLDLIRLGFPGFD